MREQVQLFLSRQDELLLSERLLALRPEVTFVDGTHWSSTEPPIKQSIAECQTNYAFLWDRSIVSTLPYLKRTDGVVEGPPNGCVIEIWRSRLDGNLMLAGRFAQSLGHPDPEVVKRLQAFAEDVWSLLKSMTRQPLVEVDSISHAVLIERVTDYRAGDGAIAWVREAEKNLLATHIRNRFFKPKK
jgi:hypothetical protein